MSRSVINTTAAERTTIARRIAGLLGPEWSLVPPNAERAEWPSRDVRRADGAGLTLHWDSYGDRLSIRGEWPSRPGYGVLCPHFNGERLRPDITVHAGKSPVQIAKDIARRFLPGYLPLWAEQLASAQAYDARQSATARTTARLTRALGIVDHHRHETARQDSRTLYGSGHIYKIDISGDRVSFEAHNVPADLAVTVLPLLLNKSNGND